MTPFWLVVVGVGAIWLVGSGKLAGFLAILFGSK